MANTLAWNLTIDDSSPIFEYMPYGDGAASAGWATYYSVSGFPQNGGGIPLGSSSHVTWSNESSMAMSFYGSAIYLYGEANCTYDVTIDEVLHSSYSPQGSLLASFTDLVSSEHTIMVKPYPGGLPSNGFSLDKAEITLHSGSSGPSDGEVYDNRNSSIAYTGEWSELNDTVIPSTSAPAPYHQTQVGGSAASLEFYGDAVMIEGPLGSGNGLYEVVLEGARVVEYNASSWWTVGDAVLYYQANLDPNKKHTISLINQRYDSSTSTIGLNTITVFGFQGSKVNNPPPPRSKVMGIAIAGYLLLLLFLAALFVYCRKLYRRRNQDQLQAGEGDFEGAHKSKSQEHELESGKLSPVSGRSLHSVDTSVESVPKYSPLVLSVLTKLN